MALVSRNGRFQGPASVRLDDIGPNNLACALVDVSVTEEFIQTDDCPDGQFYDISGEKLQATAFVFLEKKDKSINENGFKQLIEAFGWDGKDFDALIQHTETPVQISVEMETYNNKLRPKVQWLNKYGSDGNGHKAGDPAKAKDFQSRLGAKAKALFGGSPKPAPKPSGKPTPPQAQPKRPTPGTKPAQAAAPVAQCTAEEAWAAFVALGKEKNYTDEYLQQEWARIWGEMFPNTSAEEQMTPSDWARLRDEGPAKVIPF